MKAIALTPGKTDLRLVQRPEPALHADDEVKLRVIEVGICGTDREEAAGGRAAAPPGENELVMGHEMLGQVVEVGAAVRSVRRGDYAVLSVRRGCRVCPYCLAGRSDLCVSGRYTERGIKGANGYQTEFVVDKEEYLIPVPPEIVDIAVLTEPMSVAQKAIDEAGRIQASRLPDLRGGSWIMGRKAVVAGLGPVGLLAACALTLGGATVYGLDVVDPDNRRVDMLQRVGGVYVDGRQSLPPAIAQHFGAIDLIFEATGVDHIEFDLLAALGPNGVYVLTGIPGGDRPITVDGASIVRQLVLENQVLVGSVNAARAHFEMAVRDLMGARERFGDLLDQMITHRLPIESFETALRGHAADEIKTVIRWSAN